MVLSEVLDFQTPLFAGLLQLPSTGLVPAFPEVVSLQAQVFVRQLVEELLRTEML